MSFSKSISSSIKSSSSSSSASSSSVNNKKPKHILAQGNLFVDLVKETSYKSFLKVKTEYELYLVKSQLHWSLLMRMKDSDQYISLEVTTSDMSDLLQTMCIYDAESDPISQLRATSVKDYYRIKLIDVCETADQVVVQMDTYNWWGRNCQHFCNTLLQQLGFPTDNYQTTVGPNYLATPNTFDHITKLPPTPRSFIGVVAGTTMAKVLNILLVNGDREKIDKRRIDQEERFDELL